MKNILILSLLSIFIINCSTTPKLPERGICAHRGANSTHPENTLSAFREAIRLGAHMVEFDVRMTSDGELVIIHDKTVDRTTDGQGVVAEMSFAEIRALDAGAWKDSTFKREKIPTLAEVLDIMPRNIWLNVHIKGNTETAVKTAKMIIAKGRKKQAFLACKAEAAQAVRKIDNSILICNMERQNNSEEYVIGTIAMKADFIQLKERADEKLPELVKKLKQNHIKINYFRTNSPEKLKELFEIGVDFPLVDNLKEMMEAAGKIGIKPIAPQY